ncbi:hypothetical protein BS78_02G289700 [Paspalum vaginatum]|nr:hypothetical protein BS78_02G289700 [Paspalum vaginatum]
MLVDLLLARAATKAIDILLARAAPKVLNFLRATVSCSSQCDSHVKSRIQFTDNKVENNKSDKEPDVLAEEPQVSKRLKQKQGCYINHPRRTARHPRNIRMTEPHQPNVQSSFTN